MNAFSSHPLTSNCVERGAVFTRSVYDLEIGDILAHGLDAITLPSHLSEAARQVLESEEALNILAASLPGTSPEEDVLYVAADHAREGIVGMGMKGRLLYLVHIIEKE